MLNKSPGATRWRTYKGRWVETIGDLDSDQILLGYTCDLCRKPICRRITSKLWGQIFRSEIQLVCPQCVDEEFLRATL